MYTITTTHVVDPKNPGAVDEIIHLGDYWEEEKMMTNKEMIIKDNKEVGRMFKRAYGYLAAAKGTYDNIRSNLDEITDYAKVNKIAEELIYKILEKSGCSEILGKERHLFGSAVTPDGVKDRLETIIPLNKRIFVLKGKYDSGQSIILEKIGERAIETGHNVEFFHNHFDPEKVDNIVIKDISVALTTFDKFDNEENITINVDKCLKEDILDERKEEIEIDKDVYEELIQLAVANIGKAKELHDQMESYYIPNMDFDAINQLGEKILEKILNWYAEMK